MNGTIGGDFRVTRPLSEGGMGAVYIVEQISTGRRRALKVMKPELVRDPRLRERFVLESTVASKIDSEHVVEVVAAGIDEPTGAPWLAMELLEGADLAHVVSDRGPLPFAECEQALQQLAHALSRAHAAGIVHRDLKPENLFIARPRRDGIPFTLKILDFGIAKLVSDATSGAATGAIGTPLWMSPEQTDAQGNIGPAADIWPLGLIAYFMLTSHNYWRAAETSTSLTVLLKEVLVDPLEPPTLRGWLGLPPGFDAWFFRCVARDPNARFATVREAVDAFAALGNPTGASALASTLADPAAQREVAPAQPHASTRPLPTPPTTPPPMAPSPVVAKPRPKPGGGASGALVWAVVVVSVVGVLAAGGYTAKLAYDIRKAGQPLGPTKEDIAEAKRVADLLQKTDPFKHEPEAAIPIFAEDPALGTDHPLVVGTLFCGWRDDDCVTDAKATDDVMAEPTSHMRLVYKSAVPRDDAEGMLAAQAAYGVYEAAGKKGFLDFRNAVFAHRGELTRTNLVAWARDAGVLDDQSFGQRLDSKRWLDRVQRDGDLAASLRIRASALFVDCQREDPSALHARISAKKRLLDFDDRTRDSGISLGGFHAYRDGCAEPPRRAHAAGPEVPLLVRSPFASDTSDDAARDAVFRFILATSQHDAKSLASLASDPFTVGEGKVPRARFIKDRTSARVSRTASVVNVDLRVDPSDTATRLADVAMLARTGAAPAVIEQQTFRLALVSGRWIVEQEGARVAHTPKTCSERARAALLETPVLADQILAPPTKTEATAGCLAHVALLSVCYSKKCYARLACHHGTKTADIASFALEPDTGKLARVHDDKPNTELPFPRAAELRAACDVPEAVGEGSVNVWRR